MLVKYTVWDVLGDLVNYLSQYGYVCRFQPRWQFNGRRLENAIVEFAKVRHIF